MRTFEFKDAKSHKFWHIDLKAKQFTVTYGRVGAKGQTQEKDFPTAAAAKAAHDKLIAEKLAKGYVETVQQKPTPPSPLQKSLEAAIIADPDDLAAHSAYADYLIEQGDPRGEFIQVQLALEDASRSAAERKELQKREEELLQQHRREWLGAELMDMLTTYLPRWINKKRAREAWNFARGWLDRLTIYDLGAADVAVLARSPALRLLNHLTVYDTDYDDEPDLAVLGRSPYLGNVRSLQFGGSESFGGGGETALALIRKLPRLEHLDLQIHGIDTRALFGLKTLTNLRSLIVYRLTEYPMERLAANPAFAQLQTLCLWPHAHEHSDPEQAYLRLPHLRAILRSPHLQKLTKLTWRISDAGDAGCQEIVSSGILNRLKVLELESGVITDTGARILAACPELRNLELLNVARNRLTKAGVTALKNTGVNLQAGHQHGEGNADHYLYEGDIE